MSDKIEFIVNNDGRLSGLKRHSRDVNRIVRESLQEAFLKTLEMKSFEDISITELCTKAGVSRTSFYHNFSSKSEVLMAIVSDFQSELMEVIGSPFRQKVTLEWFNGLFKLVQKRADVLKPIFCAGYQDKYLGLVNGVILRHENMSARETYLRLLWCGGIVNAIVHWLATDLKEPPEVMAKICHQYLIPFNEAIGS